jgi:uncharacterized membrane protein YphA (DoxX/SURF4 family)
MALIKPARILLAIAIACFGVHSLVFAKTPGTDGHAPGPPWFPDGRWVAWAAGVCLLAVGLSLASNWKARWATMVLGISLLIRVLVVHLPRVLVNLHDPGPWTSAGEILSICGGAFVMSGALSRQTAGSTTADNGLTIRAGQVLFALPLVIVGVQHFLYAKFIATLIPAWIPGHLFWAYFVGVAFFVAALAIVTRRVVPLAPALLGLMFLRWVLILHAPRVAASQYNSDEWTSRFVALAMSGCAWAVAGTQVKRE